MTVELVTATSPQHMELYTVRYRVLCYIPTLHMFRVFLHFVFFCGPEFLMRL